MQNVNQIAKLVLIRPDYRQIDKHKRWQENESDALLLCRGGNGAGDQDCKHDLAHIVDKGGESVDCSIAEPLVQEVVVADMLLAFRVELFEPMNEEGNKSSQEDEQRYDSKGHIPSVLCISELHEADHKHIQREHPQEIIHHPPTHTHLEDLGAELPQRPITVVLCGQTVNYQTHKTVHQQHEEVAPARKSEAEPSLEIDHPRRNVSWKSAGRRVDRGEDIGKEGEPGKWKLFDEVEEIRRQLGHKSIESNHLESFKREEYRKGSAKENQSEQDQHEDGKDGASNHQGGICAWTRRIGLNLHVLDSRLQRLDAVAASSGDLWWIVDGDGEGRIGERNSRSKDDLDRPIVHHLRRELNATVGYARLQQTARPQVQAQELRRVTLNYCLLIEGHV